MAITVYTYNDKVLKNVATDKWLKKPVDPYNPFGLPAKTIRIRTTDDVELTPGNPGSLGGATVLQVVSPHVYDIEFTYTYQGVLKNYVGADKVLEILGLNTEGLTYLDNMFTDLTAITTIPLLDYTNITSVSHMFHGCTSLVTVPGLTLPNATSLSYMFNGCTGLTAMPTITLGQSALENVGSMFKGCTNIESGILDMYTMLSSKTYPAPTQYGGPYDECFTDCGSNTVTGAAELAQIPSSWGGTGA